MYFNVLKLILDPHNRYRIFLDYKDTRSAQRVKNLADVLANSMYDFNRRIVEDIQTVRSHEVQLIQLADLLIGAIGYANRAPGASVAKTALVERIRERSGYKLTQTTLMREPKLNLLRWNASDPAEE
jgi:hypothetical protein